MMQGAGCRVQGAGCKVQGVGCKAGPASTHEHGLCRFQVGVVAALIPTLSPLQVCPKAVIYCAPVSLRVHVDARCDPNSLYEHPERSQGACRVQGAGCRVQGARSDLHRHTSMVCAVSKLASLGTGCKVKGAGCRVQGVRCRVQG